MREQGEENQQSNGVAPTPPPKPDVMIHDRRVFKLYEAPVVKAAAQTTTATESGYNPFNISGQVDIDSVSDDGDGGPTAQVYVSGLVVDPLRLLAAAKLLLASAYELALARGIKIPTSIFIPDASKPEPSEVVGTITKF